MSWAKAAREQHTASLLQVALGWNYNKLAAGETAVTGIQELPARFASAEDYVRRFEPMLLEECACQLVHGEESASVSAPHMATVSSLSESAPFLTLGVTVEENTVARTFSDNDMVLVSYDRDGEDSRHALALVSAHEGERGLMLRICTDPASYAAADRPRALAMRSAVAVPDSQWYLLRLANMSTLLREWIALHLMSTLVCVDALLGKPVSERKIGSQPVPMEVPPSLQTAMEGDYNASQIAAVRSGLAGDDVLLIQGPPGTGKTKTILGILSVIMHSRAASRPAPGGGARSSSGAPTSELERLRLWRAASPWVAGVPNPRHTVHPPQTRQQALARDVMFGLGTSVVPQRLCSGGRRTRALVCAPSNSALDEIVMRLLTAGLRGPTGDVYRPTVVRVGVQVHHSVAHVALDTLVEERLAAIRKGGKGGAGRAEREMMRTTVLEDAAIVCSTLSFSGSGAFGHMARPFDVVIVDEAAQTVEPSILIPLTAGCKQVYLVGDPAQLPATVMSERAVAHGYTRSLFQRLQTIGHPVQVLDTQYRMHPAITEFPSREFYAGLLHDAPGMAEKMTAPWHEHAGLGPLAFYDVRGKEQMPSGSSSLVNKVEAEMLLCVFQQFMRKLPELTQRPATAIITPYKAQVNLLRQRFEQALGADYHKFVDIDTIDGFQGREKDITIFSTVRSRERGPIGFVRDERRINVGLTRARMSLIVIGNAASLQSDPRWTNLVQHCLRNGCLYRAVKPFRTYMDNVVAGSQLAVEPPPAEKPIDDGNDFVPQAEPGVYDEDEFSDVSDPEEYPEKLPSRGPGPPRCKRRRKAA